MLEEDKAGDDECRARKKIVTSASAANSDFRVDHMNGMTMFAANALHTDTSGL